MERYDLIILGAGPAGIQAGIHSARRGLRVLILGKAQNSAVMKGHFENYAFVEGPVAGEELIRIGSAQAKRAGASMLEEDAIGLETAEGGFTVKVESGITRKKLGVPGEKEFEGRGVSYCVDCDAGFFRKKKVLVTGDGSAAASGALHLLHFTQEVTLVTDRLGVAEGLSGELRGSKVTVLEGRKVKRITGDEVVSGVELSDGTQIPVSGVFIEKGAKGILELGASLGLALNEEGHLAVDRNMATNVPGVFAAGDVTGPPWQMAKAVGEGCVAGLKAAEYLKGGGKE
jgi:thioredoxin reductase (NADPH)